ncbi:MAG: metal-dependent hydrolase [Halodesulfurarchaeum sp.]
MMATTHALVGVALAALATLAGFDVSGPAVAAATLGGLFPDLDLYAGHRKTLHFPVYYSAGAMAAVIGAVLLPSTGTTALALFLVAAALHSVMDLFGGGLELRPWRGTSDRAVFSHFHGRWFAPRRWIRYDGAPEDLGLAALAAVPGLAVLDPSVTTWVLALLALSALYTLLRKPLVLIAEWLVGQIPARVRLRLPDRFVEDLY